MKNAAVQIARGVNLASIAMARLYSHGNQQETNFEGVMHNKRTAYCLGTVRRSFDFILPRTMYLATSSSHSLHTCTREVLQYLFTPTLTPSQLHTHTHNPRMDVPLYTVLLVRLSDHYSEIATQGIVKTSSSHSITQNFVMLPIIAV